MADRPKLRYHRAQWDLLQQYASPAFFYEHEFGSPIETDSDWGSPKTVVEAPIKEELPAAISSAGGSATSTAAAVSEESSLSESDISELIRDYRAKIERNRAASLAKIVGPPTLSRAASSNIHASAVQASSPNSPSLEERLGKVSLSAKPDNRTAPEGPRSPRGQRIKSDRKAPRIQRRKRSRTPTPKKPRPDPDIPPETQALLEYQRGIYGSGNPPQTQREGGGILAYVGKMINAKAISALLSENVDENTTDWALFTIYGNLLGYSDNTPLQQARAVAAMAGGAWRVHNQAFVQDVPEAHENARKFCKTLETFPYDHHENGLRAMIVVIDDVVVAVHDVKERLLVGAMLPLATIKQDDANLNGASDDQSAEEGQDKGKGRAEEDVGESSEEAEEEDAEEEEDDDDDDKPTSKKQILVWRAEGMADVLLGDLVDFKMPQGYF